MKDDRIPKREEHNYVVGDDEGGYHLESEMECSCEQFEIGDSVMVMTEYNSQREANPWYPDLVGKEGIITKTTTHSPIANEPLDEVIYTVTFDTPFRRGEVSEEELAKWNIPKEEWEAELTEWPFCSDEFLCRI